MCCCPKLTKDSNILVTVVVNRQKMFKLKIEFVYFLHKIVFLSETENKLYQI